MASLGAIFAELAAATDGAAGAWHPMRWRSPPSCCPGPSFTPFSRCITPTISTAQGERANGLKFPGDGKPDYWDFIYFSFVIGMTFQVSDVAVTNKWIRRSVVAHGVLSFFFTTTVVALTVNMAANAI